MKTKYLKIFILSVVNAVILSIIAWMGFKFFGKDDTAIHIAFVGPMSGQSAKVGQSTAQAIQLYLDRINKQGGINDQKIVLDIFDDQNSKTQASKVAQEIAIQNSAIAVIGHNYSSCSINGGKVYKQYRIPAVSPASTNIKVTQNNDWYFRTVFNDNLQASFLANYAKHVLQQETVSIIYTDATYSSYLVKVFEKTSQKVNINVKSKWLLSLDNNLEPQMEQIVSELQAQQQEAGLILLATHSSQGVKLVKLIRDAGIKNIMIAPDSYAGQNFSEGFLNYPAEKMTPGYYTDGIYVSTPFILDTAGGQAHEFDARYQEKYQEKQLPWQAYYAVDAAIVLIEALKQAKIQGQSETLDTDRKKIRDVLASFSTPKQAIEGNTGLNYFDGNGDALKSISMGVYSKNQLISAFEQLQSISHHQNDLEQLESARQEGRVVVVDDQYMYKTRVAYTGIKFNSIGDFDPETDAYMLDFYLWFRFQGNIDPQQIEFVNAVKPIQLDTPVIDETIGKKTYRLYRIKGNFKGNGQSSSSQFFHQQLTINFRHRDLERTQLIYVGDILGMELTDETSFLKQVQELQEKSSLDKWKIKEIDFFQGIVKQRLLGNPKYFTAGNAVEYSTFNGTIWMTSDAYAYHVIIPSQFAPSVLVFSGVIMLLLIFWSYKSQKITNLKYMWFFQAIFAFILLVSGEIFVIHWIKELLDTNQAHDIPIGTIITTFKILWWFIPAILLHIAVERFLWLPLEEKTGHRVPNLMRFVVALLIYLSALFGIIAFAFERPVTSLLATSGMLAMIVGLGIQMNLSNIFSGIALNIDRSLRVGDWVKIGSFDEGKVIDINWRVTRIETRKGYILSIPNSKVSTSKVDNFSYPDARYKLKCKVPVDPKYDPRKVEEVLRNAVLSVEQGIVKDVKPKIWLENIQGDNANGWIASYVILFETENYQHKFRVLKSVWKNIWVHLNQAGMMSAEIQPREGEAEKTVVATQPQFEEVLTEKKLQNMMTAGSL
ncbi:MAG: ABC transporter substrate-binding protein [Pseudomonadota bacterium]